MTGFTDLAQVSKQAKASHIGHRYDTLQRCQFGTDLVECCHRFDRRLYFALFDLLLLLRRREDANPQRLG